jgi:class 3 adenylate cyclase
VFQLLERLFSEFDSTADKLNVFKLGTIGDCYIAVTGIPEPIENHATVLTKFAFECGDKVKEVFADLDEEGLDTAKLDMRFGIHSGAITAGILRGTKSRFELFGDTINTASRMESTGKAGKIQVSEDTAELLRADQRGKWLRKRAEKIKAKGKGELQTFWATKEEGYRVSFLDDGKKLMKDGEEKNVKSSDENEVYCNEMNEGHAVKGVLDEFTSLNGKNAEDEETFVNDLEIYLSNQNPQILTGHDEEKGLTSSEANEVALVYYKPKHNMKDPSDGNTLPCGERLDRVHS